MTSRIQKLPEDIVRGIAAGEVAERPAAVLKELLENALDAGARHVTIEWRGAGRERIRITDDGFGMTPEEARLALERHATSKIRSLDDLHSLSTFGFRGEALPAIAAVSRFSLTTRAAAGDGWFLAVSGAKITEDRPAGAPLGTTVTVEDLFHNVPARKKFLKSDAHERGLLARIVEEAALAAPGVGFKVISEGRELYALAPQGDGALRERLQKLWGEERTAGLVAVREKNPLISVAGFLTDVHHAQPTGRFQRLFVNRRPVAHRRLTHALYDAYRGRLFTGRHPAAAIFIEIDPARVDVNVHPAKREVRFSDEQQIHDFVHQALERTLSGRTEAPAAFPSFSRAAEPRNAYAFRSESHRPSSRESAAALALQTPLPAAEPVSPPKILETLAPGAPLTLEAFREANFDPIAQLYGTYVLARWEGRCFIFDQHAAAERALYEKLSGAAQKGSPLRQTLLLPWMWEPSAEGAAIVHEHLEDFKTLGYGLEPFGGRSFRVMAVPGALGDSTHVRALLEGLTEDLLAGRIARRWDAILIRAACRGAVMAGDALETLAMKRILTDLQACASPWTCPHGRPTFLSLSDDDLARRFRRT